MIKSLVVLGTLQVLLINFMGCSILPSIKIGEEEVTPTGVGEFNPSGQSRSAKPSVLKVEVESIFEDDDDDGEGEEEEGEVTDGVEGDKNGGRITPYSRVKRRAVNNTQAIVPVTKIQEEEEDSQGILVSNSSDFDEEEEEIKALRSTLGKMSMKKVADGVRVLFEEDKAARSRMAAPSPLSPLVSDDESYEEEEEEYEYEEDDDIIDIENGKDHLPRILDGDDAFYYNSDEDEPEQIRLKPEPVEIFATEGLGLLFNSNFEWPRFPNFEEVIRSEKVQEKEGAKEGGEEKFAEKEDGVKESMIGKATQNTTTSSASASAAAINFSASFDNCDFLNELKKLNNIESIYALTAFERFKLGIAIFEQLSRSNDWKSPVKLEHFPLSIHLFRLALAVRRICSQKELLRVAQLTSEDAVLQIIVDASPSVDDILELVELLGRAEYPDACMDLLKSPAVKAVTDEIFKESDSVKAIESKFLFLHQLTAKGYMFVIEFLSLEYHQTSNLTAGLDRHQIGILCDNLLENGTLSDVEVVYVIQNLIETYQVKAFTSTDREYFAELIKNKRSADILDSIFSAF